MTRGAFEKRWTAYGGCLQVLPPPDNSTWSGSCTEQATAFAISEIMRHEKAFNIAIFCTVVWGFTIGYGDNEVYTDSYRVWRERRIKSN
jgi:hypothetical protein